MILAERFLAQNAVAPIRDSQDWNITSEHQKKEAMKKKRGDSEKLLAQEKTLQHQKPVEENPASPELHEIAEPSEERRQTSEHEIAAQSVRTFCQKMAGRFAEPQKDREEVEKPLQRFRDSLKFEGAFSCNFFSTTSSCLQLYPHISLACDNVSRHPLCWPRRRRLSMKGGKRVDGESTENYILFCIMIVSNLCQIQH